MAANTSSYTSMAVFNYRICFYIPIVYIMRNASKVLKEALFVGLLVVVGGTIVSKVIGGIFSSDLPPACKKWNKFHVMEISLFFTGVLVHFFCEAVGFNKWYCKKGAACLRR